MNHRIDILMPEEIVRVEIEDACYQILESLALDRGQSVLRLIKGLYDHDLLTRFGDQIHVTVRRSES